MTGADGRILAGILAGAACLRWALFTGFFGSDELVYAEQAVAIAQGRWPVSDYMGALRYGVNLPMAWLMMALGQNEFAANLWSLISSSGEIAIVFLFARQAWGLRAAVFSASILSVLPLHVHLAGRLMADSPLAFFVTATIASFWRGERRQSLAWYGLAGLCAGAVFWVKTAVFFPMGLVLVAHALAVRRLDARWLLTIGASLLMVAANCGLMAWITGDPWHLLRVMRGLRLVPPAADLNTDALFYLRYLLTDGRHTGLLGPLAACATVAAFMARREHAGGSVGGRIDRRIDGRIDGRADLSFVLVWAMGLLIVFSLLPVPTAGVWRLIPKQTNYMLIFVAPMALLAGWWLAERCRRTGSWLLAATLGLGLVLSAFEQQAVQVFTANSKAALRFAAAHPDARVLASEQATRWAAYARLFAAGRQPSPRLEDARSLDRIAPAGPAASGADSARPLYVVTDPETAQWDRVAGRAPFDMPQSCLSHDTVLEPAGMGLGRYVVEAVTKVLDPMPPPWGARALARLEALHRPEPAQVYRVLPDCRERPAGAG